MKKDSAPNPDLRKIALDFYTGPFHFDDMGGYIWAKGNGNTGNQMFADLDAAKERCARIRGWGALQYLKEVDCEALQDEIGMMFAEAITEYWDRAKNDLVVRLPNALAWGHTTNTVLLGRWLEDTKGVYFDIISRVKPGLDYATKPDDCDYFYSLKIPSQGINATLKEGDIITLQQGRVFLEIQPQVIHPRDVIGHTDSISIVRGIGDLAWTPPKQQN